MTTESPLAEGRHNHPPRCCCLSDQDDPAQVDGLVTCPVCPDHGELAPTVECPQCHQPAGRPHTDYCPLALREEIFAGPSAPSMLGQTSQPHTLTSGPATFSREHWSELADHDHDHDHDHCPTCESCTPATRNLFVVDDQPCTDPWHDR